MEPINHKYISFLADAAIGIAFIGIVILLVGHDLTGPVGKAFKDALDSFLSNPTITGVLGTK